MRELGASNKRTEDQQREKMGMQRFTGERFSEVVEEG